MSGRPGRLRTRSYTSLTYTYLTLPNLTSVAGSTPAWLTLGCHAVVKFSSILLSIFYFAHDLNDPDPDKNETISLKELAEQEGITL